MSGVMQYLAGFILANFFGWTWKQGLKMYRRTQTCRLDMLMCHDPAKYSSGSGSLRGLQPQTTQAQLNLTLGCATLNLAPQAIAQRPGCGKPCFYTSKVRAACRFSLEPTGELAWMKVEVLMTLRSWSHWSQARYTPFSPLGTIWGDSKTTIKTI